MNIKELGKTQILLMDVAMVTYFNQLQPGMGEAEEANIAHSDWIVDIHKQYIEAGATIIRTNTFAINRYLFPKKEEQIAQLKAAVANARAAIQERYVEIAASIGPIRQSIDMEMEDGLAD